MKKLLRSTNWLAGLALLALVFAAGCSDDEGGTKPTNHAPVISSITVNPSSVPVSSSATVTVVATDQDGDALTYAYVPNGGYVTGTGASVTWVAPSQAGNYSLAVTVTDGNGGQATTTGALVVVAGQTGITGRARVAAGVQVDLRNSAVRLYTTIENFMADLPAQTVAATGTEYNVSFTFTGLNPGYFFVDLHKDMDNSGTYSSGDYYGYYGVFSWPNVNPGQIQVTQGQMTDIGEIMLYQI